MNLADGLTLVLALFVVSVLVSLLWRHRDPKSDFDIDDLLLGEDGRASKSAMVMFVALGLSSWVVAYRALLGTLSDEMFAGYLLAWVAPTLTAIYKRPQDKEPSA